MATKTARIRTAFSKRTLENIKPPTTGRIYVYDAGEPNLALCVTAAGSRTFYRVGRVNGRPQRIKLGPFPALSVENARKMTRKMTGKIADGVDVQAERRTAREEMTFGELFGRWMEYAKEHKRTWPEDQRKYDKFLAKWAARRLSGLDATDVERLHNAVKIKSGPYQANRVLEMVKAMFSRAIDQRYWQGINPAAPIKKFVEQSRDRYLRPDEVRQFFAALEGALPDQKDFFLVLLLTGQRRGAVQAMRWADLDLAGATWTVPPADSKSGQPITLPLVPKAVEVLMARKNASEYVFPSRGKMGHLVEPKKAWQEVVAAAGLDGLRMHDLRRTLGSWQASAGVSLGIIGKSLGHAHGSRATNVYARIGELEPVRQSVGAATTAILAAGEAKPARKRKAKVKGVRKNGKA